MKTTMKAFTSPRSKVSGVTLAHKSIKLSDGINRPVVAATDDPQCTSVTDWLKAAETNPKSLQNVWLVCRPGPDEQALLGMVEATGHEEAKVVAQARWPQWAAYLHASSASGVSKVHQKYLRRVAHDPFPLAFHEAGHAIIGRHFGATIWSVDIVPRMLTANRQFSPYGTSLGRTTIYRPRVGHTKKEQRREAEQNMVYVLAGDGRRGQVPPGPQPSQQRRKRHDGDQSPAVRVPPER